MLPARGVRNDSLPYSLMFRELPFSPYGHNLRATRRSRAQEGIRGGPPSQAPVGGSTLQHFLGILAYRECRISQSEAAVRATGGFDESKNCSIELEYIE